MGERAVDLLMKRIENPNKSLDLVLVGTNLIRRDSVANIFEIKKLTK
jgi:DNA-binding LacI/PurR family transcriptional regulator